MSIFIHSPLLLLVNDPISDGSTITTHPVALVVWLGVGIAGLALGALAVTVTERKLRSASVTIATNSVRPTISRAVQGSSAKASTESALLRA